MQIPVSVKDKKSFIQWFLNNYQLKKRESVWILSYIVNHPKLLPNIHFVREAKFCPRGLVISSSCSNEPPFRFYKKQLVSTDAEKSFHDIRMNQNEPIYIQLNFSKSYQNIFYAAVLVENPFIPQEHFITEEDQELAEKILDKTIYETNRKSLQKKIDNALDERNRQSFIELTEQLHQWNCNGSDQPY